MCHCRVQGAGLDCRSTNTLPRTARVPVLNAEPDRNQRLGRQNTTYLGRLIGEKDAVCCEMDSLKKSARASIVAENIALKKILFKAAPLVQWSLKM